MTSLNSDTPGAVGGASDSLSTQAAGLPDGGAKVANDKDETTDPPKVVQKIPEALAGWAPLTPYDYNNEAPTEWDGNAAVYHWDGELGEVGPEHADLEIQLFGPPNRRQSQGIDFSKIASIELYQEGPVRVKPISKFEDAGLHPVMLRNVELSGYKIPTPIQRYCIPAINMGYDVIAVAQTGSGKTAAYLIPILNKLMGKAKKLAAPRPNPVTYRPGIDAPVRAEPLVVIVCPSRELAVQIFNEARKFCYRTMLRPCVVYGGGPMHDQVDQLQKGCDILVASPGRLVDFIERPHLLTLRRVRYMVIDEADEMLETAWSDELNKIMTGGEQEEGNIKYMLFSATFPKEARDLAATHLAENYVRLRVGRAGSTHENIKQSVVFVDPSMKRQALFDLLHSLPPTRTIVFVNSKRAADEVDDFLFNKGMPCASIHSDRTQKEREAAMRAFRAGTSPLLVATGVTARGIDVRNVMHVINYDMPSLDYGGIEEYTHRIGRTGRIGHRGLATSFYCDRDEPIASVLTRTLLETNQEVPDFLQQYIPEGDARTNLKFEADSDFDETEAAETGDDGGVWGDESGDQPTTGDGGGWGTTDNNNADAVGGGASGNGNTFASPQAAVEESTGW
ncbi:P-loop containing nucleoside triphosphate hydrolase protein [Lasiosphaeria miniovina]|uniref:RNA helicase n=1 Tax=Lasiosphaeria miniovina TaxID=1954250 RepID=A0AA40AJN0_9PEZI|nr:P-loop containing nucleoside triphosphate hydrolase protein [Lasiosphaeria miniovina]KAK0717099.1 P-loop containing nucleoside triphosphate hydrolase protein [Lasiosphaeria miniovina]